MNIPFFRRLIYDNPEVRRTLRGTGHGGEGRHRGEADAVKLESRLVDPEVLRRQRIRSPRPVEQELFVVLHIASLTWDGDTIAVEGAPFRKGAKSIYGSFAQSRVQQESGDDHSSAPLAGLAVHSDDAIVGLTKVGAHALEQGHEHHHGAWVVVIKREALDQGKAPFQIVIPFAAQIVHLERLAMALFEKLLHLPKRVAVDSLPASAREPHGDDPRCDVGQVQIEAISLKSPLVFRDPPPCLVKRPQLPRGRLEFRRHDHQRGPRSHKNGRRCGCPRTGRPVHGIRRCATADRDTKWT
mmetsp:Transcript_62978/g.204122  ORF Transcript_62978/g.204122 Transcript_62978/m.204122 type:complete len:298 (+) Transcript_62978:923-1816(+)